MTSVLAVVYSACDAIKLSFLHYILNRARQSLDGMERAFNTLLSFLVVWGLSLGGDLSVYPWVFDIRKRISRENRQLIGRGCKTCGKK